MPPNTIVVTWTTALGCKPLNGESTQRPARVNISFSGPHRQHYAGTEVEDYIDTLNFDAQATAKVVARRNRDRPITSMSHFSWHASQLLSLKRFGTKWGWKKKTNEVKAKKAELFAVGEAHNALLRSTPSLKEGCTSQYKKKIDRQDQLGRETRSPCPLEQVNAEWNVSRYTKRMNGMAGSGTTG